MVMAGDADDDLSNVFAIPDFWKSSTCLKASTDKSAEGTVFELDVNSTRDDTLISISAER